ncbi:hypothetical protein BC832DRAFT_307233 [Gaertneriomyces semiglobifer]|nr:hypothetical protein BC832DRAFT_307233 [Gaertneriomyces semiglobifer]
MNLHFGRHHQFKLGFKRLAQTLLSGATIANASVSPETPSSSQTAVASFTPTRTTLRTPEGNAATTSFALQFGGNASLKRTAAFSQHVRKATLYLIKGKRKMYLTKVPLSVDSINRGDVFILVIPRYGGTEDGEQELTGAALYLWSGSECSIVKKAKGREIAIRIQDREWNRKATLEELDDGTESQAAQKFWNTLSGGQLSHQPEAIKSAQEGGDDSEHERKIEVQMSLYGVNQNAESLYLVSKGKSLSSKIVGSGTCYVLDCFDEIYVWVGRSAKDAEKHIAAAWAEELASAPDRPEDTEVFTEKETVEGVFFMEKFVDWAESNVTLEVKRLSNIAPKDKTRYVYDRGGLDVKKTEKIDVKNMFEPPAPPVSWDRVEGEEENFGGPPNPEMDRGRLDLKVWLAQTTEGQGRVEVAKAEYGYFYSQESYLILYRHLTGREGNEKEAMIAYFWIGADCKGTEQGIAAYMAAHLDKKLQARQIRVTEGKEPAHFLRIFRENSTPMIVRRGTRAEYNHTEKILYHVKGFNEDEVRVIETAWAVSSLSSADSFVASLKDRVFVWHGAGSFAFQRSVAANAAQRLAAEADKQVQEVEELEEPKVFWQKLAGSDKKNHQYTDDYGSSVPLRTMKKNFAGVYKCRLFRVSHIIHGNPSSEEISPFVQADLDPTGVYILDAFFSIFVWVGSEARSNYKDVRLGLETALEYADYVGMQESVRNLDRTNIRLTYSGNEPPVFKSAFIAFEDGGDDITGSTGFLNKLKKRGASKKKTAKVVDESAAEILEKFNKASYSFDELKKKDNLPLGVDPTHVEAYLSENDFKKHFKIDKDTFSSYPAWKQAELKKRAGLF